MSFISISTIYIKHYHILAIYYLYMYYVYNVQDQN